MDAEVDDAAGVFAGVCGDDVVWDRGDFAFDFLVNRAWSPKMATPLGADDEFHSPASLDPDPACGRDRWGVFAQCEDCAHLGAGGCSCDIRDRTRDDSEIRFAPGSFEVKRGERD